MLDWPIVGGIQETLHAAKSPGPRRPAGGLETYEKTCPDDLVMGLAQTPHPSRGFIPALDGPTIR